MADAITALHTELDFAAYEAQLKDVAGVWSSLQKLRAKATGKTGLQAYKQFLVRCIKNLNSETDLSEDDCQTAIKTFVDYYNAQIDALGVEVIERNRGMLSWYTWLEKWHPIEFEHYALAFEACNQRQTNRRFEALRAAFDAAMKVYVEAIPQNDGS